MERLTLLGVTELKGQFFTLSTTHIKVPINPKLLFCLNKYMYNSEQNGAKIFDLGQNRNFLRIFKVAENRDSETHYRAAEIAEKEWVECSS